MQYHIAHDRFLIMNSIRNNSTNPVSLGTLREVILANYRTLPVQPSNQYDGVLHAANQYHEFAMSVRFMQIRIPGKENDLPNVIKMYTECMMNTWDPLSMWEDILLWRANLCLKMAEAGSNDMNSPYITPVYPIILISRAARQQNLPEIALEYLNSFPTQKPGGSQENLMPSSVSSICEFERWKERQHISLNCGIQDISAFAELKIDQLNDSQKASCQYLRGLFAQKESRVDDAIAYFYNSIQSSRRYWRPWEALTQIFFSQWKRTNDVKYVQQILNCCFQLLLTRIDNIKIIPQLLQVLFAVSDNHQIVRDASNIFVHISPNIWLPFLPLLLSRPSRQQFAVLESIISVSARRYPQAVFFPLHVLCMNLGMPVHSHYNTSIGFFEGTRSSESGESAPTIPLSSSTVALSSVKYQLDRLLSIPSPVPSQLLLFLQTLVSMPYEPYRLLVASLDRVLEVVHTEIAQVGLNALRDPVPSRICRLLSVLCSQLFNINKAVPSTFAFLKRYHDAFHKDFNPVCLKKSNHTDKNDNDSLPNPEFPASLEALLKRLLLWKELALRNANSLANQSIFMMSYYTTRFLANTVEIPTLCTHPIDRQTCLLQNLQASLPNLYLQRHGDRYVEMVDERGNSYHFFIEQTHCEDMQIEQHLLTFQNVYHRICIDSSPVQMRHLEPTYPFTLPITPTLKLVRTNSYGVTMEGIYRSVLGASFDEKQLAFALQQHSMNTSPFTAPTTPTTKSATAASEVFEQMCEKTVLSQYVYVYE